MTEKKRRERSDRKHRFTLRLEQRDFNRLRVISFNAGISLNRVCEMLLIGALEEGHLVDKIYAAHPPGKHQFIYLEEGDM